MDDLSFWLDETEIIITSSPDYTDELSLRDTLEKVKVCVWHYILHDIQKWPVNQTSHAEFHKINELGEKCCRLHIKLKVYNISDGDFESASILLQLLVEDIGVEQLNTIDALSQHWVSIESCIESAMH